jgi:tripartite-type tricarboxylate transporter receptor subunit TctC
MDRREILKTSGTALLVGTAGCTGTIGGGGGSEFPSEDITVFLPYGPGGSTAPRIQIAQKINQEQDIFGVDLVPTDKSGGGGIVAYNSVYNAEPDGYTLSGAQAAAMILKPLLSDEAEYDPREFTYLPNISQAWVGTTTHPDSDINSGNDIFDALNEGAKFSAVSITSMITSNLMALGAVSGLVEPGTVLDSLVQYGVGEYQAAVAKGEVDFSASSYANIAPFVEEGRVEIPLWLHLEENLPEECRELAPEADTLDDVDGISRSQAETLRNLYPLNAWAPHFGPPGIPEERVRILREGFNEIIQSDAYWEEMRNAGVLFPNHLSSEETEAELSAAYNGWEAHPNTLDLWRS